MNIVSLSGSPSHASRSAWLLRFTESRLRASSHRIDHISLRDLPAADLLAARAGAEGIAAAVDRIRTADLVLVGTPIYKAAYSGLLKVFLDLLPPDALRGKAVLPLATGGSPGHMLAIDYAVKPVLSALGARHILDGVYVLDSQLVPSDRHGYAPDDEVVTRIDRALAGLFDAPWRAAGAAVPLEAAAPC